MISDIVQIDKTSRRPIHAQVAEAFAQAAASGRLKAGSRLPSIRDLSERLNLSPGTVQAAYRELENGKLVEIRARSGVYLIGAPAAATDGIASVGAVAAGGGGSEPRREFSLHRIEPNLRRHPVAEFGRLVAEMAEAEEAAGGYEDYRGASALRQALSDLFRDDGISFIAENEILVSAGAQQAISLMARSAGATLRVAVEDPTYPGARLAFQAAGAELVPLPAGEDGFESATLEAAADRVAIDLFYACPTFSNPSGRSWSIDTREQVLRIAARRNITVLEDDYLGDLDYLDEKLPRLAALAPAAGAEVVYVRTFSKCLLPALRIAGIGADAATIDRLLKRKYADDICGSAFLQRPLARFITDGRYRKHLEKIKPHYRRIREALRQEFSRRPNGLEDLKLSDPAGGLCLLGRLGDDYDQGRFLAECRGAGLRLSDGGEFWMRREDGARRFRLSFGSLEADEVPRVAALLRGAAVRSRNDTFASIL